MYQPSFFRGLVTRWGILITAMHLYVLCRISPLVQRNDPPSYQKVELFLKIGRSVSPIITLSPNPFAHHLNNYPMNSNGA